MKYKILKIISSAKRVSDKILGFMPLGMGLIIILIGIIVQINNKKYLRTALTTEAVISDIIIDSGIDDEDYEVHVAYNVNNVDYDGVLSEYNSGMRKGQRITIYYNPKNPSECRGKSTDFSDYICIGFGVVWVLLFVVMQK